MANFPTSLDDGTSLPNPGANAFTNNPSHAGLHDTANDAIKAIEAKVGIGSSTPTTGKVFRGTGTGTSAWAQLDLTTDVTGILPVANGGTGLSSLGSGVVTFLGTPSSANLIAAMTDETGTGSLVFATSPTLSSPTLTTPTIASFVNATHDHSNSANGGLISAAAIPSASVSPTKLNTGAAAGYVATSETTSSTSFTDLATTGPAVTVTIGANGLALVSIYCFFGNNGTNTSRMGFALSGSNTVAATNTYDIEIGSSVGFKGGATFLLTGLSAGSTTFTAKYNVGAGTGTFIDRRISVVPL